MRTLFDRLKSYTWAKLFIIYTRYLIGFAFVHASLPKIMGERFTRIGIDNPVGFYFEAMYQSGFYWNFLGWSQMIAAVLIMTQRYATLGAVMFLPIITNIFLVTWSIGFSGTPVVTFFMLLATIMLLIWEFDKLKVLLPADNESISIHYSPDPFMHKPIWIFQGIAIISVVLFADLTTAARTIKSISIGLILVSITVTAFYFLFRKKSEQLSNGSLNRV